MKRAITVTSSCLLIGMLTSGQAFGEESGKDILRKAADATTKVTTASYKADYTGTGWVAQHVADVRGTAIIGGRSEWDIARFRCDVKLRKPQPKDDDKDVAGEAKSESQGLWSDEVKSFTAGCDGDVYFLIDPQAKIAYQDMDPAVLGADSRNLQRVILPEFSAKEPFKEALEAKSVEIVGSESVAGEDCHRVTVKTSEPSPAAVDWYISKKDYLPRKVVRTYNNRSDPEGPQGTTELTISQLVINPKFKADPFKLVVPSGFKKTDEFAP
jgi:outer membrane lipoprotein-sorting protein